MNTRQLLTAFISLLVVLAPVGTESTDTSSDNYALEWHTTTGNGGGDAESTNYAVELTVGQVGIGETQGTSYDAQIGFWYGMETENPIFSDGFESGNVLAWSSATP
ncbi:MAG: hypothetical protein K8R59_10685 [Thermoanaerobaculales bacterium]|nr:hypothetical protein [Thermoanaerobaculales bacterium]